PRAACSPPLPAATALPGGAAICNSFRPTACRSCRSKTQTPNQDQNQTHPLSRSPLEETLEADISTWQKTGHFYFALTLVGVHSDGSIILMRCAASDRVVATRRRAGFYVVGG